MTICFIDTLGLLYTGNTVYKRGLGGSESAVIYLGEELAAIGFVVTVYNHCEKEGEYKGVTYLDLSHIRDNDQVFDILISSRSILPLVSQKFGEEVWSKFNVDIGIYETISPLAKFKAVWMHDTFLEGEEYLEPLLVSGEIQEVFLLSDWHSHYVSQADHWGTRKRDYASLKKYIFQTRNGIRPYIKSPKIEDKDPNLFVYNASVHKGMTTLVRKIWPEIKRELPLVKLMVLGGYYLGAGKEGTADEQEKLYYNLKDNFDGKQGITFTGIITQQEVAQILSKATFMIYPPAFPETFGISTVEALYYNVIPITSRFGALEQTAIEEMSYLMNYNIHEQDDQQRDKFITLVKMAYNNTYLTQQKQHKCVEIRDWVSWGTVALQWRAHFYRKFDRMMGREEIEKVRTISSTVNRLFRTRHINLEDQREFFPLKQEKRLVVISPVRNAVNYIDKCINSVAMQLYDNYTHYIIDDWSTDETVTIALATIKSLPIELRAKFSVIQNIKSVGALANQISTIGEVATDDDVILLLDGDDWFCNDPDIFSYINNLYPRYEMSYGSCWSLADQIPLIAQEYPEEVKKAKEFREYKFSWGIPYTHLRTFSYRLFNKIDKSLLLNASTSSPYKAGGDGALLYALLEACDSDKIKCVQRLLVNYNDTNPLNDYKVNSEEQNVNRDVIQKKTKKTILIGIPTAKYIESDTFKSVYDLEIPEGFRTQFEFFYGYNIAQIRNLMSDWTIRNKFDYIFWVDSDIILPKDALAKLLRHNKQCVAGIYLQRKPEEIIPEVYLHNETNGVRNANLEEILQPQLLSVAGVGFGCMLTTRQILETIGYPQFEYKNSLDHQYTISEDVDFCSKVLKANEHIFVDTSIRCSHIGIRVYKIE